MAHIRSRKHAKTISPLLSQSLVALAALATPLAGQAQQKGAAEQSLPEVKVRSSADAPFKADTVSSPKLTQPLVDTPQTISVIKKEVIQEQGLTTVVEALRNTPGITLQLGENGNTAVGDTFQMRGFSTDTSIFVDGIRDLGAVTRDTFNIDQVEVVKGPAGADVGRGAASGYINLVSKLPSADNFADGSVSANDAGTKRVSADVNRKIGETSAVRVNLMGQGGDVAGRDVVENKSVGIAPSLAVGLGTPTRFYLYSQHIRQDNVPDGGVPTVGLPGFYNADATLRNGARVNEENFYGSTEDYEKVHTDMVTAKIEHDLGQGIVLRNISRYGKATVDRVLTGVNAPAAPSADPATWTVARTRQRIDRENEILANQTNLTAEFATGGIKHSLSTGLELMYEKQSLPTFPAPAAASITPANLYNPDPNVSLPIPVANGAYANGHTSTVALYAFDTLKLTDRWQVNGGLRFERYNTETDSVTASTATTHPTLPVGTLVPASLKKSDSLLSWKIGALYKPAENGSIYAALANSHTPPGASNFSLSANTTGGTAINNPALDPQKTTNIEIGTKWELLQKKLALTAAVYRTDHKNEIVQIDPLTNTFGQFGKRRVEGVELGAVGQITPAWQLSAGIATMDTEVLEGSTGNNSAGAASRWSPELTATLWSSYKLTDKWTVGGGARYVSEQKRVVDPSANAATQNMPGIPSYWVADAMVSYQATKNVSLQLNVANLFDKSYISTLNNSGARYTPGAPRTVLLTANMMY